ncbi:MAG: excinuclease ABC subunit C [Bacteroidetes bacterium]|nr:excinuclease ABC subunit C [Bacteroidota bacterium]
MEMSHLQEKVSNLPLFPGVYIYRDKSGNVLYVGKAKRLKNRVRSYFQDSSNHSARIIAMVRKIDDIEVMITDSETEALILENTLIKKYQPRYNILYRDDKTYPYICITNEERPRVFPTRTILKDGSQYFGPYDSVGGMKRMLEVIRKAFDLCTCAVSIKTLDKTKNTPKWNSCFDDYLGSCSAERDLLEYQTTIEKVTKLINGRTRELIKEIKEEMEMASSAMEFEQAAYLRDSLFAVQRFSERMKVVADNDLDRDLFVVARHEGIQEACGLLLKIREGKLVGKFHRFIRDVNDIPDAALLQSFLEDYYTSDHQITLPDEVYLSHPLVDEELLHIFIEEKKSKKIPFRVPERGDKAKLIQMALTNAKLYLDERALTLEKRERDRIPVSITDLKKYLNLQRVPRRIECFDNSNFQGEYPVASMVSFVDAKPRKKAYKHFHIKTVVGPDDFASMHEVLTRRYSRLMQSSDQIPDLIVVDGGKGQLSSAIKALKEIGFYGQCEIIGLAKRLEEVFLPGRKDAIMIPKSSPALKLLQQVRDEAHRFAITFHRNIRSNHIIQTELTSIDGIGEKTAKALLKKFGSVENIRNLDLDTLSQEIGNKKAQSIFDYLNDQKNAKEANE